MTESTSKYFPRRSTTNRHCKNEALRKLHKNKPVKIKYEEAESVKSEGINNVKIKKVKKEEPDEERKEKDNKRVCWFPNNWKLQLENIKEMRKDRTAVVDSQGCERTADMNEKPEVCVGSL